MVLTKLILEKYLNNRFYDGLAKGEEQSDRKWRAWYSRMMEAQAKGEQFDELPTRYEQRRTRE